jgi:mono/diheme cytochrome c family protein
MKALLIALLSVFWLITGFVFGDVFYVNRIESLKDDLALSQTMLYMCETGIDPKDKLDTDPLLLASKTGEVIYKANCAICHGASGEGKVGPDIRYSSLELLNLKVVEGRYPEGYKPQRDTKVMPRFPHLYPKLPDVLEYLKSRR